jgi:hypothetical protein
VADAGADIAWSDVLDLILEAQRQTLDDPAAIEAVVDMVLEQSESLEDLWRSIASLYRVDLDLLALVIRRRQAAASPSELIGNGSAGQAYTQ